MARVSAKGQVVAVAAKHIVTVSNQGGENMRFIGLVCVSLLMLLSPAHAWTWKGKEKLINDIIVGAYRDAFTDNFEKALAECKKTYPIAGSDHYLLGRAELCTADVLDMRHHSPESCPHYARVLSLWATLPANSEDVERPGKLREWIPLIRHSQKMSKCR